MAAVHRKIAGWPKPEEASSHLEDGEINTNEQRGQGTAGLDEGEDPQDT